jgi:hypothetical protein
MQPGEPTSVTSIKPDMVNNAAFAETLSNLLSQQLDVLAARSRNWNDVVAASGLGERGFAIVAL